MAVLTLPVDSENPSYEFQVDLEGATHTLRFDFNTRAGLWQMSLLDAAAENLVIGSVPVLTGVSLFSNYKAAPGIPPGDFVAINEADPGADAGRDDLGSAVKLFYAESGDGR